jgi:excinuclease UvrABC nuclease subunit
MRTELYRHYDADDQLLYIGVSSNTKTRLTQHPGRWRKTVARTEITEFNDRLEAAAAEAEAIRTEKPKFNITHLPQCDRHGQHTMTNKQYREAIRKLGMTQAQAAKFLDISIRTSNGYANTRLIPEGIAMLLRLMVRLNLTPVDVD